MGAGVAQLTVGVALLTVSGTLALAEGIFRGLGERPCGSVCHIPRAFVLHHQRDALHQRGGSFGVSTYGVPELTSP